MKNIALLFITSFLLNYAAFAQNQTFGFIPGAYIEEQINLVEYKNIRIEIEHPQLDEATFGWVLVENNFLSKWDYSTCDNHGCYGGIPDSSMFGPLPADVNGFIRITLTANSQAGTGTVKLYIYDVKFPENGQFATFAVTASEITAIGEPVDNQFTVFPNPVTDLLNINASSNRTGSFTLADFIGKVLINTEIGCQSTTSFDLSGLPQGLYFATFGDLKDKRTMKIIKK